MAEAKAEAKKDSGGEGSSAAGKIIGLVLAVGNIAVLGGGAFLAYQGTLGYQPPVLREPAALEALHKEREASAGKGEPVLYTMEPFTANLGDTRPRMIRIGVTLQMLDQDGFEEVVAHNPAARDAIVRILNSKAFPDIESVQGKLWLKDQIATSLNGFLKRGVVENVYFNDFLVQ